MYLLNEAKAWKIQENKKLSNCYLHYTLLLTQWVINGPPPQSPRQLFYYRELPPNAKPLQQGRVNRWHRSDRYVRPCQEQVPSLHHSRWLCRERHGERVQQR